MSGRKCLCVLLPVLTLTGCSLFNQPDELLIPPSEITSETDALCIDGDDNDGDGLTDCADPNCRSHPDCRTETSFLACSDGIDNDEDGASDCEDPGCFFRYHCFVTSPFVRDPPCDAGSAYELVEDFSGTEIDSTKWAVFSSTISDRPGIDQTAGAFFANGRDGNRSAGIVSLDDFEIGSDQQFSLDLGLLVSDRCDSENGVNRCKLELILSTRGEWGDDKDIAGSLLYASIAGGEVPGTLRFHCFYHNRALHPEPSHLLPYNDLSQTYALQIRNDGGDAVFAVDGEDLCRASLTRVEPDVHLVLTSGGRERPGKILVDEINLRVEPPVGCRGLVPDGFCGDDLHNAAASVPQVARATGAGSADYRMVFSAGHCAYHTDVLESVSQDAGKTWTIAPADRTIGAPPHSGIMGNNHAGGGLLFNEALDRFEVWVRTDYMRDLGPEAEEGAFMFVSPRGEPGTWERLDGHVTLDDVDQVPKTVVLRDGTYRSWYTGLENGFKAIFHATSDDGLTWVSDEQPVFVSGEGGEWDSEGVSYPSVIWTGEYYLMTYTASPFDQVSKIGLAISNDGIRWERYAENPIIGGERGGFDDHGAYGASILMDDEVLRVWYTAKAEGLVCDPSPSSCPGFTSLRERERVGYTELRVSSQ